MKSDLKSEKNLLFNPGPTNVSEDVRNAIRTKDICHREKEFFEVLLRVNKNLTKVLNGSETHSAVLFASSGTGANEAICASIHGKVLVINNGKYSDRICDILGIYKIPINRLKLDSLQPIDLNLIEQQLQGDKEITHIYLVHHETTTGMLSPLRKVGEVASKYDKLLCVDSVSSLGGHEFDLQKDNISFCSVSANKCLESFPGISFVIARNSELEKLQGKSRSFYFNLYEQWKKEQKGETPFTPPVQIIYAMDRALQEFIEEGYEARIIRYKELAATMREGLKKLGFELILFPEEYQSNILTTIKMPEVMDYWNIHDKLKERGITIYSDKSVLDKGRFRVATLGHITSRDIDWFLQNLQEVMGEGGLLNNRENKKIQAIILAAGMGTRFGDETKDIPKHLLEVEGKSILERSLENLKRNNISEVIIVVGYKKEKIISKIGDEFGGMKIKYAVNDLYDTTSTAISFFKSKEFMDSDAIMVLGDVLYEPDAVKLVLEDSAQDIMFVMPVSGAKNPAYVTVDDKLNLIDIPRGKENEPRAYGEVADIYKISRESLQILYKIIGEEYQTGIRSRYIEDAILGLSRMTPVKCIKRDLLWLGVNTREDLERARNEIYPKIKEKIKFENCS